METTTTTTTTYKRNSPNGHDTIVQEYSFDSSVTDVDMDAKISADIEVDEESQEHEDDDEEEEEFNQTRMNCVIMTNNLFYVVMLKTYL